MNQIGYACCLNTNIGKYEPLEFYLNIVPDVSHYIWGAGSRFFLNINVHFIWEMNEWEGLKKIEDVLVVEEEESERNTLAQMLSLKNINNVHAKTVFEVLQM